ncbi:hypothetical protein NPA31_018875 [Aurantimonas sp. MSK8Z-1]|uniref:hypothetical protein n=1 Tax=Mangrovibrevibacter kandeliae TaxID=2968473 RepID=UPI00211809F2|nr:hypothetical protein [Aurantimonas sp. MSK8Z-1]MCW4117028.1 hypothetical protein [Aurantimonas sp. MSK8Z-1]
MGQTEASSGEKPMSRLPPDSAVSTAADHWTPDHVDRLLVGDVVYLRERVEILDRSKQQLDGRFAVMRDQKNPKRVVYGWRKSRALIEELGCTVTNHPDGRGDHRGFDRRVLLRILASECDEPEKAGSCRWLLQRVTTQYARNGRDQLRFTYRLEGSGPSPRIDPWRKMADQQANNVAAWADLRPRILAKCKAEMMSPALLLGRLDRYADSDDPESLSIETGAAVWGGREPMNDELRERIVSLLERPAPRPLAPDECPF